MQQDTEAMLTGDLAHQGHDQQVVVVGQVALLEDRCQLKLVGGYLVVACLHGDT